MTLSAECEELSEGFRYRQPGPGGCCCRRWVAALLLWVSILTATQVVSVTVYVTFYLTAGPNAQLPPTPWTDDRGLLVFEVNATAQEHSRKNVIHWKTQSTASLHGSLKSENLTIAKDGCYFLYVQVSLFETQREETVVRVMERASRRSVLEGRLSNATLSTGFLGRLVELSRHDTLVVTIDPDVSAKINTTEHATYMGIYWVAR